MGNYVGWCENRAPPSSEFVEDTEKNKPRLSDYGKFSNARKNTDISILCELMTSKKKIPTKRIKFRWLKSVNYIGSIATIHIIKILSDDPSLAENREALEKSEIINKICENMKCS